jgi:glycine/D-amino acid oxidase-like deaminating enzyme
MNAVPITSRCDVAVIGGGAIGLATAHVLLERHPGLRVTLVERRSEVRINGGRGDTELAGDTLTSIAPTSGTGRRELQEFLRRFDVPLAPTAHLIVATGSDQRIRLRELFDRAGTDLAPEWIEGEELTVIEPALSGSAAIRVPGTLLADARAISSALAVSVLPRVEVQLGTEVDGIAFRRSVAELATSSGTIVAGQVINCAGREAHSVLKATAGCPPRNTSSFQEDIVERRSLGPIGSLPSHIISTLPISRADTAGTFMVARPDGLLSVKSRQVRARTNGLRRFGHFERRVDGETLLRPVFGELARIDLREVSRERRIRTVLHGVWDAGPSILRHQSSTHILDLGERSLSAAFRAAVEAVDDDTVSQRLVG